MTIEGHVGPLLATLRELDDAARARVEAHVAGCAECRADKAAYAQQDCLLSELPIVPASARLGAAVRARIAPSAPTLRPAWLPRAAVIVATLVVVALSAGTLAVSAQALPGDFLYPVKRSVEQVALTVLSVSQQQAAFEDAIAERRRFEARQVLKLQRDVPVEFAGALEHLEDGGWAVAGLPIALDPGALDAAGVKSGDAVVISGETHRGQIRVRAVNREPRRAAAPTVPASPMGTPTHTPTPSPQPADAGARLSATPTPPASTATVAPSPTASPQPPFPRRTPGPRQTALPSGPTPTPMHPPTETRRPHWPLPSDTPAAADTPPPATPTPHQPRPRQPSPPPWPTHRR